jgi:hypothetical protein
LSGLSSSDRAHAHLAAALHRQGINPVGIELGRNFVGIGVTDAERNQRAAITEDGRAHRLSAQRMIRRLMRSPVLKRVLCNPTNFTFNRNCVNMARINRAELGDFDALVLGLLLMAQFKGQLVVPDFGFFGRDFHASLIPQNRLIAGVNSLAELTPKLRQSVLLINDKVACSTTGDDAETLALYAGMRRWTNKFNEYVQ